MAKTIATSDAPPAKSDTTLVANDIDDKRFMTKKMFASKLQVALEGYNLTKLAKELDMPSSVLHDWIRGSRSPSMKNLALVKRLANHVGLNFEELILGDKFKGEKTLTTVTFSDGGNTYSVSITKLKDNSEEH